jgi:chromatin segregation and condensation protein Rec8/ScpA/Scc1 (kleisin family)
MAATLIHWKSRSLLPSDTRGQRQADPIRDDLVQQLLAHRKQAAEELGRRRSAEEARVSRPANTGSGEESATGKAEEPFLSVWDMIQQAREIARWVRGYREYRQEGREAFGIEQDEVTVSEMVEYLRTQLAAAEGLKLDGLRLLGNQPTAARRSCLFLGMLEMACNQQLGVEQEEDFGPISLAHGVAGRAGQNRNGQKGD